MAKKFKVNYHWFIVIFYFLKFEEIKTASQYVTQAGLELPILLSSSPNCCDYKNMLLSHFIHF